jgi:hypothetical protein
MSRLVVPVIAASLVMACSSAGAGDTFQLTPFIGFQFGGGVENLSDGSDFDVDPSASYGLVFDKTLKNKETTFEFVWNRQDTRIDVERLSGRFPLVIDYFHFGATYSPSESDGFVVVTAGATYFDPGGGYGSETKFSVAAGGGIRKMFNDTLGLRVEGRAYLTFAGGSSAIFCTGGGGGGNCLFAFSGDAVVQAEIDAGLILAF